MLAVEQLHLSNKTAFKQNLYARIRIRPLIYYANLRKYLDEEWTIIEINNQYFRVHNPLNGYDATIGHDARREWIDDLSIQDGLKHGIIILKAQIILKDSQSYVEPLTDAFLAKAMARHADHR